MVFAVQDPLESPDCVCQAQAIQQEVFHKGLPTGNLDAMGDLARAFRIEMLKEAFVYRGRVAEFRATDVLGATPVLCRTRT